MHRFAITLGLLAFSFGCSSSSDNGSPADTGGGAVDSTIDTATDASTNDTKPDSSTADTTDASEIVSATTCGAAPYVTVTVHASDYSSKKPVAGALLNASICPGSTFVSDATGTFVGQISKGVAFDPRFSADTYVTMRLGEEKLNADFEASIPLLPDLLTAILPDWATDKPTTLVIVAPAISLGDGGVDAADSSNPCDNKDGIVVAVTGHPEATVVYFKDGPIPSADATLTATSTAGLAEIANIPTSAAPIQVTGTKTGCSVTFATSPLTGNYSLENGVLTVATGVVGP